MLTKDFTGEYDYEREEAEHEAEYIRECIEEAENNEIEIARIVARIEKLGAHWNRALCGGESFADFVRHFNSAMPSARFHIKAQ
jgi:phosphoenolpyruvate carboxylase